MSLQSLVGLYFRQEAREADLRYGLVRLRENAESIAFYGGEKNEAKLVLQQLSNAVGNFQRRLVVSRNLGFFTTYYRYVIKLLPAAIVAPLFFQVWAGAHVPFFARPPSFCGLATSCIQNRYMFTFVSENTDGGIKARQYFIPV